MAYKICQFIATNNLSGIPSNRSYRPISPNSFLLIPERKNVLVKKIALDCVYNSPGDLLINDYLMNFAFINPDSFINPLKPNDRSIFINPIGGMNSFLSQQIGLNKSNPVLNLNNYFSGLLISQSQIRLSNTTSPITSNVSFIISIYYED